MRQSLGALPAAPGHLVGRDSESSALLGLLDPAGAEADLPVVCAVAGPPGVGKTAVALHIAHHAVDSGWFPGGVLFADLRGYDPQASVSATEIVTSWLRDLGVPDAELPSTEDERTRLYRSILSDLTREGRGLLLVADNASSAAQVRDLIPAGRAHRLLVTSRETLAKLPARLVRLDQLESDPAAELITGILVRARPHDPRPSVEPEGLARLAAQCGGFPLALEIIAEILTADPGLSLAALADELDGGRVGLAFGADGRGASCLAGVADAFRASYRRLDVPLARAFRLLSLAPGPDISTEAAAVLIGVSRAESARAVLAELTRASLLTERPVGSDRWLMHDLIREYAGRLVDSDPNHDEREAALDRLLACYMLLANAASYALRARPDEVAPARFNGRAEALVWFDAECSVLVEAVRVGAATGRATLALRLSERLAVYLHWRRRLVQAITTAETALAAARGLGDRGEESQALTILGRALHEVRRFEDAFSIHRQAIAIYREIGDRKGEFAALALLGGAFSAARRFDEAASAHQQVETFCRETGDRHGEARAQTNLGLALRELGRVGEALEALRRAVEILHELGDVHGEAMALDNLALALRGVGKVDEALTAHRRAVEIFRNSDDAYGLAKATTNLGHALQRAEQLDEAISAYAQAVEIFRESGDRHGEGMALGNLATALLQMGHLGEAVTKQVQAAEIFRETGDRHREGTALNSLGVGFLQARRYDAAMVALIRAVEIFRETSDSDSEYMARANLGLALQQAQARLRRRFWRRPRTKPAAR